MTQTFSRLFACLSCCLLLAGPAVLFGQELTQSKQPGSAVENAGTSNSNEDVGAGVEVTGNPDDSGALKFKDTHSPETAASPWGYFLLVSVLLVLIGSLVYFRRKLFSVASPSGTAIVVRARKRISYQSYVTLLEIEGDRYILAEGSHGLSLMPAPRGLADIPSDNA